MLKLIDNKVQLHRYAVSYVCLEMDVREKVASEKERDLLLKRHLGATSAPLDQTDNEWLEGMSFDTRAEALKALEQGVDYLGNSKLSEIGKACTMTIHNGIEVDGNRYALTEHDQTELMAQLSMVKEGVQGVPYHADGELCRIYPATEFLEVATAATNHIFYHRTYCNHLNVWIRRCEDIAELKGIVYGIELPEDLAANMHAVLEAAGGAQ